jgi:hypothetical protein
MADSECHPLSESQEEGLHNVDPFELAISEQLAEALTEWAGQYTASLNQSDPTASGFRDKVGGERRGFGGGSALAAQLRGAGFDVSYFHEGNRPELVAANE